MIMRTITAVVLLLTLALCAAGASAQIKRIYTWGDSLTATSTWTLYQKPGYFDRILGFRVVHDGGTGKLLIAFYSGGTADTATGKRFVYGPYEGEAWTNLSIDGLWVRSMTGTIPFRLAGW
jgi:hypothetical protein